MKRLLSLLSAAVVALSAMTSVVSADVLYYDAAPVDSLYYYTVRLADEPLAKYDYALKNGVDEFVFTDEGKAVYEDLMSDHDASLQTISKKLGRDVERVYDYTSVFNGFTVALRTSEYNQIYDDPQSFDVDKIYLSGNYTEGAASEISTSNSTNTKLSYSDLTDKILEQTGVSQVAEKGDTTVIAVIDNEFDIEHEFLNSMPENAVCTVSEEYINNASPYLSATSTGGSGYYYNEKIPYRFDYEKRNTDTSISGTEEFHGTHVAGIAAGNGAAETDSKYDPKGVAPNAQLMLLSMGSIMYDYKTLAAYNDCAYLGADVVNASFGITMMTYNALYQEAIENLTASGIMFCASAGNSSKYPFSGTDTILNTDYSTGGVPDAISSAFAVASADNNVSETYAVTAGGNNYRIIPGSVDISEKFGGTEKKLVVVPGYGYPEDYEGLDVKGKVVLVKRGELFFDEKAQNARDNGAVGIIFYNNTPIEFTSQIQCNILPSGFISQESGLSIIESGTESVLFNSELMIVSDPNNKISYFSTWGFTDELMLKPDITAFGGNILSSAPGNKYTFESGTSMSAPQMTGIGALLKEYLQKNAEKYGIVNNTGYSELMTKLLMSTATPIYYDDGLEIASPRVQGSGLVNVEKAMNTPAYLYTESAKDNYRPKLSLGDNFEKHIGDLSFTTSNFFFHIKNISDESRTYSLSGKIFRDDCVIDEETGEAELANGIAEMTDSRFIFKNDSMTEINEITVGPGEDVIVYIDVDMSTDDCQYIEDHFPNGTFIDGYVFLTSDSAPTLSLPFMGYYGEWSESDIFEPFIYKSNKIAFPSYMADNNNNISGVNMIAGMGEEMLTEQIPAYSPNGDNIMDNISILLALKRRCRNVNAEIYSNSGKRVYIEKYSLDYAYGFLDENEERGLYNFQINWDFDGVTDGEIYTIRITAEKPLAESGASREIISQEFLIDTQAPEITDCKKVQTPDGEKLILKVTDNNAVQGAIVYDPMNEEIAGYDYCTQKSTTDCSFTIELPESNNGMKAVLYDMAGNSVSIDVDDAESAYNLSYDDEMFFSTKDKDFKNKIKLVDADGNALNFVTVPSTPQKAFDEGVTEISIMSGKNVIGTIPVTIGKAGDADYNETVNILDAITVAKYVLWKNDPNGPFKPLFRNYEGSRMAYLADYDRNGKIDLIDAISISKLLMPQKK